MKNVSEVNYLYGSAFTKKLDHEQMALLGQLNAQEELPEDKQDAGKVAELRGALDLSLSPTQKADLVRGGITNVHDRMPITLTLGELIYDLYSAAAPKPAAPLKAAIHVRNLTELAQQLQKPEIDEKHPVVVNAIRSIASLMMDDVAWAQVKITVTARTPSGEDRAVRLGSSSASLFPAVIAETIAAVERADKLV